MMNVQTDRRVLRGREGWRALLAGFEGSGLSAEAFCRREGISSASFYRWRSVLGNGGGRRCAVVVRNATPTFVDAGALELPRSQPLSSRLDLLRLRIAAMRSIGGRSRIRQTVRYRAERRMKITAEVFDAYPPFAILGEQ
jgi:hypothetical protein